MPRYERTEGSSRQFWEIELSGASFTTRAGQVGADGQSNSQRFVNVETAEYEYQQRILSKENDGYRISAASAPATTEQVVVRLDDGTGWWRELELRGARLIQRSLSSNDEESTRFDDFREAKEQLEFLIGRYLKQGYKELSRTHGLVAPEPVPDAVKWSSHPELEAACLAAPDDLAPWRIYADWLQEHGDMRGELAALFLAREPQAAWIRLRTDRDALLGPHSERELFDLTVTNGFISGATLKRPAYDSETNLSALTSDFLARPGARFVSELKFGLADFESNNDWAPTVKVLCEAPQARQLRKLEFTEYGREDCEISWTPFGDFSAVWSRLPALEHLHLRAGGAGTLGRIEHAKLQTLIRESGGLPRAEVEELLNAKCPALERLEIWTGSNNYGSDSTADDFAELLRGERFPRLNHLGVVNSEFVRDLVQLLVNSPLLRRLRVLDFSKGVLTDEDVDLLLRVAPKFAHLRLDLSGNLFAERLDELRRALPLAVLDNQREDYGDEDRYVAIGE